MHGQHVVSRSESKRSRPFAQERNVAEMHVGIGDQRSEGGKKPHFARIFWSDQSGSQKRRCRVRPGATIADELIVQRAERHQTGATAKPDTIESDNLQKRPRTVLEELSSCRAMTTFPQHNACQVLRQQQVGPPLGRGELNQHMMCVKHATTHDRREFRLLSARRRTRYSSHQSLVSERCVTRWSVGGRYERCASRQREPPSKGFVADQKVTHDVLTTPGNSAESGYSVLVPNPFYRAGKAHSTDGIDRRRQGEEVKQFAV